VERLIRLLRIINIIQESPGIKAIKLAELCETSERNIYRDLEILSAANIPIMNEGHSKGYKFIGNFKQYPLNWDEDEFKAFTLLPVLL
jgi:predicted DNA-binding transcriptional regulator YafY